MRKINLLKPDKHNLNTYLYTGSFLFFIAVFDVFLSSFFTFIISRILLALIGIIGNKRILMFLICSTIEYKIEFIFLTSVFLSDQGSESLKYLLESKEYSITCFI